MITVVNYSKKLSDTDASAMVDACRWQLLHHAAPAWKRSAMPIIFQKSDRWPKSDYAIGIWDAPDMEGVLGYHTEEKGQISGRVFVDPVLAGGGTFLGDAHKPLEGSVSSVLSHEILEFFGDPFCNAWYDGPSIKEGFQYCCEICDPVEAHSYPVSVTSGSVMVSNFVWPAWFDPQADKAETLDQMQVIKTPFTLAEGGYFVVRSKAGKEKEVFAAHRPAWKLESKRHPLARTAQRLAKGQRLLVEHSDE